MVFSTHFVLILIWLEGGTKKQPVKIQFLIIPRKTPDFIKRRSTRGSFFFFWFGFWALTHKTRVIATWIVCLDHSSKKSCNKVKGGAWDGFSGPLGEALRMPAYIVAVINFGDYIFSSCFLFHESGSVSKKKSFLFSLLPLWWPGVTCQSSCQLLVLVFF